MYAQLKAKFKMEIFSGRCPICNRPDVVAYLYDCGLHTDVAGFLEYLSNMTQSQMTKEYEVIGTTSGLLKDTM